MAPTKPKKSKDKPAQAKNKKKVASEAKAKIARATKGTKAVKAAPPPVEDTRKLPGAKFIKDLARQVLIAQEESASAGGEAGALISSAVKNKGLNAKVFKDALKLRKMGLSNPMKLRVYLDDMVYMAECLELEKLAGDQLFEARAGAQEMDDAGEESDGETEDQTDDPDLPEGEPEPRADADNIHRLGRGHVAA